jgi:hypothetical protein
MLTVPHLLRAVHVLFNEPEILLIIRRQPDMVRSYYRHALEEGYHKNFPTFVGFRDGQFTGFRLGRFVGFNVDPTALDFFNFVAFLETSFGSGKVHVLPYEWIQQNFDRFCGALAQITGAQLPAAIGAPPIVNRGLREGDIVLIRTLNRIWDSRIFGLPLIPRLTLLSHYERARRGGGVLRRIALAVGRRFSPLGALHVLGPVLTPLLNSLRSLLGLTGLKLEQEIEKAIEISVSDSNAALNQKLGGILTGLGYCDRR